MKEYIDKQGIRRDEKIMVCVCVLKHRICYVGINKLNNKISRMK